MYEIIKTARVSTSFLKGFHFKIVRRNSEMLIFIKNLKKRIFKRKDHVEDFSKIFKIGIFKIKYLRSLLSLYADFSAFNDGSC